MNTLEQAMAIHNKIASLMDKKRGVITLHFYDGRKITGNVKAGNASFGVDKQPSITVTTFTNNIDDTTVHNLFEVQDVS
jgi:hypothetical protein